MPYIPKRFVPITFLLHSLMLWNLGYRPFNKPSEGPLVTLTWARVCPSDGQDGGEALSSRTQDSMRAVSTVLEGRRKEKKILQLKGYELSRPKKSEPEVGREP